MWTPEAYIGSITKDGVIEHPDPANPNSDTIFLIAEISPTRFFKEAKYYPTQDHRRDFIDNMYRWTVDTIYLVSDSRDDTDEIFCIAFGPPFNFPLLFGKLHQDCEIYKQCVAAFASVS